MRFSLAGVTGAILLGFSSLLLSVEGAPYGQGITLACDYTGSVRFCAQPSHPVFNGLLYNSNSALEERSTKYKRAKTYAPVAVPNPFDSTHGYKESKNFIPDRKYGDVYTITTPHYTGTLDLIAINSKDKSITVKDANNADDATPAAEKLSLAGIMMGLFVNVGKFKATDLSIVRFDTVVEPTTKTVITKIYTSLGKVKGDTTTFTVTSTTTDAKEKEAFTELLDTTKFGSNVQKLNGLYSTGKTVKSFTLSGNGPMLEFQLE